MTSKKVTNPAFGTVRINRHSGETCLFGVDYPQAHYISIEITEADLHVDGLAERPHETKSIIQIALSEVQFAAAICGIGSTSSPCTIQRRHVSVSDLDPQVAERVRERVRVLNKEANSQSLHSGRHGRSQEADDLMKLLSANGQFNYIGLPPLPDQIDRRADAMSDAVKETVDDTVDAIEKALATVTEMLESGSIRKGDLNKAKEELQRARREAGSNLPYTMERAQEEIDGARDKGKAEIEAYFSFAKRRLGEEALTQMAARAVALGQNPADALLAITDGNVE